MGVNYVRVFINGSSNRTFMELKSLKMRMVGMWGNSSNRTFMELK